MYEKEKQEIINTGIMLDRYGLIALSGGNVSMKIAEDRVLVTPSGMFYSTLEPADILLVDMNGNIKEGTRKASVDTEALLYIYNHIPKVNAIIHTHQPYATALGLVMNRIPCQLTTLANATRGAVAVAPYTSAASVDMGKAAVEYLEDKLAVILKNHGVIEVGNSLRQALYSCVYLEEAAKTQAVASCIDKNVQEMTQEQVARAVEVFDMYGQGK